MALVGFIGITCMVCAGSFIPPAVFGIVTCVVLDGAGEIFRGGAFHFMPRKGGGGHWMVRRPGTKGGI